MNGNRVQPSYWFPKPFADFVQRLRVVSGFVLLVTFAFFSHPVPRSMLLGMPVCLVGLIIRAWSAGHLAKNENLASGGPYAYVRNPLYLGTLLVAVGVVVACRSFVLGAIALAVFVLVYLPVIELEEQHLRTIFPSYSAYASYVWRLLPIRKWPGSHGSFSWPLYRRNQEYKAALGFALALLWLCWKCFR